VIKVGKFILEHGPIIATQEIGKIMYGFINGKKRQEDKCPQKYVNIFNATLM
jgi:hypothetical protein